MTPADQPALRACGLAAFTLMFDAIETLGPIDQIIIFKRFGIGCEDLTLQQIGDQFGMTRERIRQQENKALAHISRRLYEWLDEQVSEVEPSVQAGILAQVTRE